MIIPVSTKRRRLSIRIGIVTSRRLDLGIWVSDGRKENTFYIRRRVPFLREEGSFREIKIPLPVSPEVLYLEVFNKTGREDEGFKVSYLKLEEMAASKVWADQDMHDYISFAERFCEKAGYCKTGFYHSKDYSFLIHYLPQITGMMGETLATPARIHRVTGRCQVNQQMFKRYSIPVRLFILLHERQHFTIPTREEKPADLGALKLYLDLGYPVIEAVYAVTKIFKQPGNIVSAAHLQRTKDIIHFIDAYKAQNKLEETAV